MKDTIQVKIMNQEKYPLKINQRDPLAKGISHTSTKQPGAAQEKMLRKT